MAQNLKSTCYNLTHLTPLGEFAMSEIILSLTLIVMIVIMTFLLKDRLLNAFFRADKKGIEVQVHAEPSAKVKITGVYQSNKSKMQVEHDDAEITGVVQRDGSRMDVKLPAQPKKSKK